VTSSQSVHPANLAAAVVSDPAARAPPAPALDRTESLTADLRRLHITVSKRFLDKLAAARDALSHSVPGADTEAVLEAALDLLLEKNDRKKGLVKKPRKALARPSVRPRHIPAEVKRAVWIRDGGKPVAGRLGRRLRVDAAARAGSHRAGRARWTVDGRQPPGHLQVPQRPRGAAGLRGRVDGAVPVAAG
jgi:hypothetical protein